MKTGSIGMMVLLAAFVPANAAEQSENTLAIPAASATVKTEGGKFAGPHAREGDWNLYSNGDVGDYIVLDKAGAYELVVTAFGSPCEGVWPLMAVNVDGEARKTLHVESATFADYTFPLELGEGVYRVTVAFLNDKLVGKEDRNLYLRSLKLRATGPTPEPRLATPEQWAGKCLQQEDAILAQADASIEKLRKGDIAVLVEDADGKPVSGAKVSVEMASHDFLFGSNIYMFDRFKTQKENDAYKQAFADLLNYATVGFYWRWYEPQRGRPDYGYTDQVVQWCQDHRIRMKGHPLLWGDEAGIPTWSKGQPAAELQQARVNEIMRRYSGKIANWEVVNEPAHQTGVPIDPAYRWARQANADAYLIVNDYEVMANGFPPLFNLLEKAKADGLPFDGIGIQAHEPRTMRFPLAQVRRVLDHYATLGKELHITEFTPTSGGQTIDSALVPGKWDEKNQADYAVKFYRTCFAHPAMAGITWWDLCDNGAWQPGGGMLRKDLTPKPVYQALHKLIREDWWTHASGATDATGRLTARGFFGRYVVTVSANGKTAKAEFNFPRKEAAAGPAMWKIRL